MKKILMKYRKKLTIFSDKYPVIKKLLLKIYIPTIGRYISYKKNKVFRQKGKEALFAIDRVFDDLDINYWLEFGTMLGAVREKDFISHDLDIDVACFLDDYHLDNEKIFNKHGFRKSREILIDGGNFGREETYVYQEVSIDIFYFHRRDDEMYCHAFAKLGDKSRPSTIRELGGLVVRELRYPYGGFKKILFLGKHFSIPANIGEHLSASYGSNYMVKDPNYTNSIATNVRILSNKLGIVREYS